jgi:ubiquinone/menaquinone biosynthesis C-methylase UbiE
VTPDPSVPDAAARTQAVAAVFDRSARTYDSVGVPWFTPIAEHLVRELAPTPGERALDLGSGRGAALFPLADELGPTGHVTGVDLAPGMVRSLKTDVEARGLRNVDVQLMDAGAPDLGEATFDLLASSLVLFFLPDPVAALRNWRQLLVPGGRIGISTFGRQDPIWEETDALFRPYLPKQMLDARTSGATGPFGSDEAVEGLFETAGFTNIRTAINDVTVNFRDADQWREWSWSHGQRAMWEHVPEDQRDDLLATAAVVLEAARTNNGSIQLSQRVRYTIARR